MTAILGLFSLLGSVFSGVMGFKTQQAKTIDSALEVVKAVDDKDAEAVAALSNAMQVILTQGTWLERNWRSWLMVICMLILGFSFFGYIPPHFNDPLSPMMLKVFDLIEIGLGGYIVRRGIVDIVRMFNIGSVIKAFIQKKLV